MRDGLWVCVIVGVVGSVAAQQSGCGSPLRNDRDGTPTNVGGAGSSGAVDPKHEVLPPVPNPNTPMSFSAVVSGSGGLTTSTGLTTSSGGHVTAASSGSGMTTSTGTISSGGFSSAASAVTTGSAR
jgi:hypothetical protein